MTSHNKHKPIYPSLMSKQTISSPFKPAQSPPTVSRKYQQLTPMPIPTFLLEKKLPQVPQTEREHQKNKEVLEKRTDSINQNDNFINEAKNTFICRTKRRENAYKMGEMEAFDDFSTFSKEIDRNTDERKSKRVKLNLDEKKEVIQADIESNLYQIDKLNTKTPKETLSSRSQISPSVSPTGRYLRSSTKEGEDHRNYLNKYEIIKELGKGTYGIVYLGKWINMGNKLEENKIEKESKFKIVNEQQEENTKENKEKYFSTRLSSFNSFTEEDKNKVIEESKRTLSNSKNFVQREEMGAVIKYNEYKIETRKRLTNRESRELSEENGRKSKLETRRKQEINLKQKYSNEKNGEIFRKEKERQKRSLTLQNSHLNSPIKPRKFRSSQKVNKVYYNSITVRSLKSQEENADESPECLFAIKVYEKFKMNKDPAKFKNIRKEITIMQNISHPNVINLYESVESLTKISLVLEYGGSQSLLDYLKVHYPLSELTMKKIGNQLIQALNYLHKKNIVHRDIKLQNILMGSNDEIKLIDFGFATLTFPGRKLTAICGTPNYMAPEVLSKKEYDGEKADVWSYGIVMFTLVEGRHPFKAETYSELEKIVNQGIYDFKKTKNTLHHDFIRKILKIKPEERPKTEEVIKHPWLALSCKTLEVQK